MSKKATTGKDADRLAAEGGTPAVTAPGPDRWGLGPAEIGREELAAVTAALTSRRLFRFEMDRADSWVARLEDGMAEKTGARYALAGCGTGQACVGQTFAAFGFPLSTARPVPPPAWARPPRRM